jgi:hypothetical protein
MMARVCRIHGRIHYFVYHSCTTLVRVVLHLHATVQLYILITKGWVWLRYGRAPAVLLLLRSSSEADTVILYTRHACRQLWLFTM